MIISLVPLESWCFRAEADNGAHVDLLRGLPPRIEDIENIHSQLVQASALLARPGAVGEHTDLVHIPGEEGDHQDDTNHIGGIE